VLKRAADVFGASVAAVAGTVALLTSQPWLFPGLGPTVLVHAEQSDAPAASPRLRILAAAGSLAITGAVLILLDATHPAATASTLLVSLGLLRTPAQLIIAFGAVVLVTVVDWIVARVAARPMPVWRAAPREVS
jgi:hypothetical protein